MIQWRSLVENTYAHVNTQKNSQQNYNLNPKYIYIISWPGAFQWEEESPTSQIIYSVVYIHLSFFLRLEIKGLGCSLVCSSAPCPDLFSTRFSLYHVL